MTVLARSNHPGSQSLFINAANQSVLVGGIPFAYRDLGPRTEVPLVMFNPVSYTHLTLPTTPYV